jgi:hypothetical protein
MMWYNAVHQLFISVKPLFGLYYFCRPLRHWNLPSVRAISVSKKRRSPTAGSSPFIAFMEQAVIAVLVILAKVLADWNWSGTRRMARL